MQPSTFIEYDCAVVLLLNSFNSFYLDFFFFFSRQDRIIITKRAFENMLPLSCTLDNFLVPSHVAIT